MLWDTIKESLQTSLPESEFGLWIQPLVCRQQDEAVLELAGPDRFFCAWIQERYLDIIQQEVQAHQAGCQVRISVADGVAAVQASSTRQGQLSLPGLKKQGPRFGSLHPGYTFEQFMVGESNMLARSACQALARGDSTYGNCLYMNGGTGLGKSHLAQAVVHQILAVAPSTNLHYLTAQQFSAEMVKGIKTNSMDHFARKYVQECDILLVEDVHTLAGKTKTQEELNIILDYLIKSGKRVVLTSSRPPRKLTGLDEEFRSRMTSGLVTDIKAPEFPTRVNIIRHKASLYDLLLEDDQVEYLARHLKGDVRRTESALLGIKARTCVRDTTPDMALVKSVVQELVGAPVEISGTLIRDVVGCEFRVSVEELRSKSRKRAITFPRQVAMYLTRKYTDQSLADIGALYNRDHSTVLHAIKVVTTEMSRKPSVRKQLEMLCEKLNKKTD